MTGHCKLRTANCILQFVLLCVLTCSNIVLADEISPPKSPEKPPAKQKLLERTPFDVIVVKGASGGTRLEVLPASLPQRPLTAIPKEGSLKVRLLDRPAEDYEVNWASVAQVRVFEQLLMDEGLRLAAAGQFDEAYDYFGRLRVEYPNMPGLEDAISEYLQRNAMALYEAKQHDRAGPVALAPPAKSILCRPAERPGSSSRRNHPALPSRRQLRGRPPRARSLADTISRRRLPGRD